MLNFTELSNKINITFGFLITIIISVAAGTAVYLNFNTIEGRMDKRHHRYEKTVNDLNSNIIELQDDKINHLIKHHELEIQILELQYKTGIKK